MEFRNAIAFKLLESPKINIQQIDLIISNWTSNPTLKSLNHSILEITNYNFWLSDFIFDVSLPKFKIGNQKRYVNY